MAVIVTRTRIDDMDGTSDTTVENRTWKVGTVTYSADLSKANWEKLLAAIEPFNKIASTRVGLTSDGGESDLTKTIRAWAAKDGRWPNIATSRGRIPEEVRAAYFEAVEALKVADKQPPADDTADDETDDAPANDTPADDTPADDTPANDTTKPTPTPKTTRKR